MLRSDTVFFLVTARLKNTNNREAYDAAPPLWSKILYHNDNFKTVKVVILIRINRLKF